MATRTTRKDLEYRVKEINARLCSDGSNYQLIDGGNICGTSLYLGAVIESGTIRNLGDCLELGSPRDCVIAADSAYYNYCDSNHRSPITRETAKGILFNNGMSFKKDVVQISQSDLMLLAKWAKLTKYRKSATSPMSTGAAFYLHLQKKVSILACK